MVAAKQQMGNCLARVRKSGWAFALCFAAFCQLSATAQSFDPQEAKQIANQAVDLMAKRQPAAALELLNRSLIRYPQSASIHFEMGNAYSDMKDYESAIKEYETALRLRPGYPEAILNLGYAHSNAGRNAVGVAWFEKFIRENPHSPKVQEVRSLMLVSAAQQSLNNERAYDAKKLLEKALVLNPKDAHVHFKLARACDELGDTQSAIEEYNEVLKLQPQNSAATFNIAGCYQTLGRPDLAISWFQRYLKKNPKAPDASTVNNMIDKLKQTKGIPMSDPRKPDFVESVMENGKVFRWRQDRFPLRVFVDDGSHIPGFRATFITALRDAFTVWSQASQNTIRFTAANSPDDADIVCTWTGDPYDVRQTSGDVEQGICKTKSVERSNETFICIEHADIRILTTDRETGRSISDEDMKKTCLHELGHALGLHGHSANNHDIMFFSVSPTVWPVLSKRDKATLLKIYQIYAPVVR